MPENTQHNFSEKGRIKELARFDFLDLCLLGETGTGKTYTARLIHEQSPRAHHPFVAVNCAELTPSIIESELFGHERGAFTGAVSTKAGKFEAASGGTILLDEIGELPVSLQAKLLKVVEEKTVTRVGANRARYVDVRIIYATHVDLSVLREDLRYRIAAHAIYLKPLRERRDEIVPLARIFINQFSRRAGRVVDAGDRALKLLETAPWRGNVRELRSFVERLCLTALFDVKNDLVVELKEDLVRLRLTEEFFKQEGKIRNLGDLNLEPAPAENLAELLKRIEAKLLKNALSINDNNKSRAARDLGMSRTGLIKKLKRIGAH